MTRGYRWEVLAESEMMFTGDLKFWVFGDVMLSRILE